ncbi:MAG: HK97 family phage prohead protease [Acidimicrobiia bacterium]|nr:HK97 family phage prohead protease [Acidimicrobiia bacterium]
MSEIPRDDLIRMIGNAPIEFREDEDGGRTLTGVPIVFNEWTEINGWEGNFLERIDPGALTKTLEERGDKVKVLFNHGMDPQIGDKPLGKPSRMDVKPDGLHVEVPLARTSYNDDLLELMRVGAIDGQSFRFSVKREEVNQRPERSSHNPQGLPERTVKELRLYEFGPVTFPAYEATTVGVRAREAYMAWRQSHSDADPVTSEETPDTPPIEAPVGRTKKQRLYLAEKARRSLGIAS